MAVHDACLVSMMHFWVERFTGQLVYNYAISASAAMVVFGNTVALGKQTLPITGKRHHRRSVDAY